MQGGRCGGEASKFNRRGDMLEPMQSSVPAAPPPTPRSFAGLLADFAAPEKKFPPALDADGLADDVATLTYEHALRWRTPSAGTKETALPSVISPAQPRDMQLEVDAPDVVATQPPPFDWQRRAHSAASAPVTAERKCASVTVRLTHSEDERLRQRSAEAGLTLSAYLRSCAFEVESLRADVKQTLAALRQTAEPAPRRSLWQRLWGRIAGKSAPA